MNLNAGKRIQAKETICKMIGNRLANMGAGPRGCPNIIIYEPKMPYELILQELQQKFDAVE
jgi:hypothetical protein